MRTLILGLDAFDPDVFERLHEQGKLRNLADYVKAKRYNRFRVSNPPQSEVSWTSIATGLNPGEHGLFDFVHRDPGTYSLYVSLLPSKEGFGGSHFVRPHRARTIFDTASDKGFPATTLWWPATFPARPESPVRTLPGLGTPDIRGRLGVGTLFTSDADFSADGLKTPVETLKRSRKDDYSAYLPGPVRKTRQGNSTTRLPFRLEIASEQSARLKIGTHSVELRIGDWSPILELKFKMGLFFSVQAITRVVITQLQPDIRLYFLPLQIHPLNSPWPYGSPGSFVKHSWQYNGPYLTLGWPQDTQALDDGIITDQQFLSLCNSIYQARVNVLMRLLKNFDEGIIGAVFDTLDRVQHMFWKDRPDIVEAWYLKLDALAGQVEHHFSLKSSRDDRLVIVSDHGFANFDYKVHLNRWLIDHGFLVPKNSQAYGQWKDIDWLHSSAYSIGLNSLYLNLADREGQGMVQPKQHEPILSDLELGLLALKDPDGYPVVQKVWRAQEAFNGVNVDRGPDLVIGFSPGYRASAETGLGGWEREAVVSNADHWNADHCINPLAVPGVIFANGELEHISRPSYYDIPFLTIGEGPDARGGGPPDDISTEDEEVIQERLKSLGYF
ncbi:MAG TPA: alkaline phosphatase family protein [Anaerolineales bacterium]